ncbi:MAG: pentapeptide repeat-containing protein, partial [Ardenticatenia bacterium]
MVQPNAEKPAGEKIILTRQEVLSAASMAYGEGRAPDFSNQHLDGLNLSSSTLEQANFQGASLLGTVLVDSNLTGAHFEGAMLFKADLYAATANECNFT